MLAQTKLVIFDKDGVLIDTELAKTDSYYLALSEINRDGIVISVAEGTRYDSYFETVVPFEGRPVEYSGWSKEKYMAWHSNALTGKSRGDAVRGILRVFIELENVIKKNFHVYLNEISEIGGDAAKELYSDAFQYPHEQMLSAIRMKHYLKKPIKDCCKPIGQMNQFLQLLVSQKTKVALITESEWSRTSAELNECGIWPSTFQFIACKDQIVNGDGKKVRVGGKKSQMYGEILRLTKISANKCLAVEDTDKGRGEALEAGIACLQVFYP